MRDSRGLKPPQQSFKEIAVSLLILQQKKLQFLIFIVLPCILITSKLLGAVHAAPHSVHTPQPETHAATTLQYL